jgi:prephenate dehydrogenase (NADP+)
MLIGIIGLGDMGRLYAKAFAKAGYTVCGCDMPANREKLEAELNPLGITLMDSGKDIAHTCDLIIYSVEADKLPAVVAEFGPITKYGAIVAGQTSVKASRNSLRLKSIYLPDAQDYYLSCYAWAGF